MGPPAQNQVTAGYRVEADRMRKEGSAKGSARRRRAHRARTSRWANK